MRALLPEPVAQVDDDYLLERYAGTEATFVRFNFVSSIDGSAQLDGLSGQLGSAADHRIFALLRRLAQVVLVGAGTVRAEGYDGPLVSAQDARWREAHGLTPHPTLAIVSHGLNIAPTAPVLTDSPAPVLLFTSRDVSDEVRGQYPEHVRLVRVPEALGGCDPKAIVEQLQELGHRFIHAEGGPHLFGQFCAAGQVDSVCVSYSPLLVAGRGSRIALNDAQVQQNFVLHTLLEEDSMLFTEYRRRA